MRCFGVAGVLLLVAARSVVEGACETYVSNSDELQAVVASGASCAVWAGAPIGGVYPDFSVTVSITDFTLSCAETISDARVFVNAVMLHIRGCDFIGVTTIKGDYDTIEDNKLRLDHVGFFGAVELYAMTSDLYAADVSVTATTPNIQTIVKVVYGSLTGKWPLRIFHTNTVEPTANEVRGMEVISARVDLDQGVWMEHVHSNSGCSLFIKGDACASASFKAPVVSARWSNSVTGSGVHVEGTVEVDLGLLEVDFSTGLSAVRLGDLSMPGVSQLKTGEARFLNNTVGAVLRQTRSGHTEIGTLTTTGNQVEEAVVSNAGYFETSTWHSKCDTMDTTASSSDLMLLTNKGSNSSQKVETLVIDATDNGQQC